jgi:hypothetical protein
MSDTYFSIPVLLPDTDVLTFLSIHETGETFETDLFGDFIALLYLGESSWNLIKGNIDQETVNIIGQAIEDLHLKKK